MTLPSPPHLTVPHPCPHPLNRILRPREVCCGCPVERCICTSAPAPRTHRPHQPSSLRGISPTNGLSRPQCPPLPSPRQQHGPACPRTCGQHRNVCSPPSTRSKPIPSARVGTAPSPLPLRMPPPRCADGDPPGGERRAGDGAGGPAMARVRLGTRRPLVPQGPPLVPWGPPVVP